MLGAAQDGDLSGTKSIELDSRDARPIASGCKQMPNSIEEDGAGDRTGRVRVLIVQDHPLLASAIREFLEAEPDLVVCGVVRTGRAAIASSSQEKPEVVLTDH